MKWKLDDSKLVYGVGSKEIKESVLRKLLIRLKKKRNMIKLPSQSESHNSYLLRLRN
ncbi:MAG: hypothetical protein GPJ52_07570 [Candidatus Heimdallarchaeota archaeon]|nr:hypothetical protein [Candidatus Heimdallarchaeota archaeon]